MAGLVKKSQPFRWIPIAVALLSEGATNWVSSRPIVIVCSRLNTSDLRNGATFPGILRPPIKMGQPWSQWLQQPAPCSNLLQPAPFDAPQVRVGSAELRGHRAAVLCLAWAEGIEGSLLASGAADGQVILWNAPWRQRSTSMYNLGLFSR